MYKYCAEDKRLLNERVNQFQNQTHRYFNGELTEDEFRPLRLQNGVYIQRYAPMFRIAVPYGSLNSTQFRTIAKIAEDYDKGYVHISTRQNLQLNWCELADIPEILHKLAKVDMHAIQTSGNCIRNITTDYLAGIDSEETTDPRLWCEIIRQWSTLHPEFAYLPRKFKIALHANSAEDRALTLVNDIGLLLVKQDNQLGFKVYVGGGLGRTPIVGSLIYDFVPSTQILQYLEAILRFYNLYGRRDNKFKARIKILVKALGAETFRARIEEHLSEVKKHTKPLTQWQIDEIASRFEKPALQTYDLIYTENNDDIDFLSWRLKNVHQHKELGYCAVTISIKKKNAPPGDIDSQEMYWIANLADKFSLSYLRTTINQDILLPFVPIDSVYDLFKELKQNNFTFAKVNSSFDITCCPGGDFCSLANAKSIPIANAIQNVLSDNLADNAQDVTISVSGCMNACSGHHISNIGILGVDKKGEEFYQVSLGGFSGAKNNELHTEIAQIIGPSFKANEVANVVNSIFKIYFEHKEANEQFIDTVKRIGVTKFKEKIYGNVNS